MPNGDSSILDRRASSNYEPRLNRVPSLPPTREVDEEEAARPRKRIKKIVPVSRKAQSEVGSQQSDVETQDPEDEQEGDAPDEDSVGYVLDR